jgi:hypothetical protein
MTYHYAYLGGKIMNPIYVIIIKTAGEKLYVKVSNVDSDNKYIVGLSDYINASVFSGEQVEEIVPFLKQNGNDLCIYAEKIGEIPTL